MAKEMSGTLNEDLLDLACDLARAGGQLARRRLGHATTSRKADRTLVTDADHAVQELILTRIAERYPHHAILAEETVRQPARHTAVGDSEYCWVIDPIDGTRNFARGIPLFTTSIAVVRHPTSAQPVVAAVYEPTLDQLYAAVAGAGATMNGQPLSVAAEPARSDTLIAVPSGRNKPTPPPVRAWLDRWNLRNLGSAALHLALVAAGSIDAAFCQECYVWDVAAGWLLVTEAGGRCTDLAGRSIFPTDLLGVAERETPFLAAGPVLHAELLKTL